MEEELAHLAEEGAGQPGTHLRVLFQPAFHPPGCVTLRIVEGDGVIECIWPGPTGLHAAEARVPAAVLAQFQAAIHGLDLLTLGDIQPGRGRDGILINGVVVVEGAVGTFAAWSPTLVGEPPVYRVCLALLDLSRACLFEAQTAAVLTQIQAYLHPG